MQLFHDQHDLAQMPHAMVIFGDRAASLTYLLALLSKKENLVPGSPDLLVLDCTTFGVDESELARQYVSRAAVGGRKAIIMSASHFTHQAQNALLKILEEPASQTTFFLLAEQEEALLGTVRSRVVACTEHGRSEGREALRRQAEQFLSGTTSGRLQLLEPFLRVYDNDEAKRGQRSAARGFVLELQTAFLAAKKAHTHEGADFLFRASTLLATPAANLRLIFEHLSFALPTK